MAPASPAEGELAVDNGGVTTPLPTPNLGRSTAGKRDGAVGERDERAKRVQVDSDLVIEQRDAFAELLRGVLESALGA